MKQIVCLFFILLFTSIAVAENQGQSIIEYARPYPTPKITVEEWKTFHDKIASEMTSVQQLFDGHQLELFVDVNKGLQIYFTAEGHPAHPAWVTRYAYSVEQVADYGEIGYFAGEEEPFARLFKFQQALTAKMRESLAEEYAKKSKQ